MPRNLPHSFASRIGRDRLDVQQAPADIFLRPGPRAIQVACLRCVEVFRVLYTRVSCHSICGSFWDDDLQNLVALLHRILADINLLAHRVEFLAHLLHAGFSRGSVQA